MYIQIGLPVLVIVQVINENNEHDTNYTTYSSLYLISPTLQCQGNMNIVVCGCALLSSFTATKGQRTQKELWQRNKLMQSY